DLARGGTAVHAAAVPAAADHTVADDGGARRRAGYGLRHARRRPAGPVAAVLPARALRRRARPAGRDRRAGLAHHLLPLLVRAPAGGARRGRRRGTARP